MKSIVFMSRTEALRYVPVNGSSALISIFDRKDGPVSGLAGWSDVLQLRFHDTDGTLMGLELFSDEMAAEVLAFAHKHRDADEFVVHCAEGNSRSAAIALFLADKYNVPCLRDGHPKTTRTWPFFNRFVYDSLRRVDANAAEIAWELSSARTDRG